MPLHFLLQFQNHFDVHVRGRQGADSEMVISRPRRTTMCHRIALQPVIPWLCIMEVVVDSFKSILSLRRIMPTGTSSL